MQAKQRATSLTSSATFDRSQRGGRRLSPGAVASGEILSSQIGWACLRGQAVAGYGASRTSIGQGAMLELLAGSGEFWLRLARQRSLLGYLKESLPEFIHQKYAFVRSPETMLRSSVVEYAFPSPAAQQRDRDHRNTNETLQEHYSQVKIYCIA